jgi:hypothetical protein
MTSYSPTEISYKDSDVHAEFVRNNCMKYINISSMVFSCNIRSVPASVGSDNNTRKPRIETRPHEKYKYIKLRCFERRSFVG